jgi:hypothetical protein
MIMRRIGLVYLFIAALVFTDCSKWGYVRLNYPLDPEISVPDNIQTIALVNRSLTKKADKQNKTIESIVTGEIAGSDKLASDECLKGVFDRASGYKRINCVIPARIRLYGTGTRVTPELLDWKLVKNICDSSKADALLVLETFDSNSDLVLSTVTNQVRSAIESGSLKPAVPNQVKMSVVAFWRLYDPSVKKIVDQFQSTNYMTFNCIGRDLTLPPPEALPNTAYAAGQQYIERFLPSYYTVKRDMYKRGKGRSKQDFLAAFRSAEVANWQRAIEQWTEILKNTSRKNAGRACLNIAVSYEVLGNTDEALQWAKRSYEQYNDKLGRDYAKILLDRKNIEY